ncbi:MAG: hypothetical protein V4556_00895 [Bacteroidota bacterium]
MFAKYLFCFIALLLIFTGCKNDEQAILKESDIDKSLVLATTTIDEANKIIYRSLEEKLVDPRSSKFAKILEPKVINVQAISNEIFEYIESLKNELRKKASLKDSIPFSYKFDTKNKSAVTVIFQHEKKSDELLNKLKEYQSRINSIDSELTAKSQESFIYLQNDFYNIYFKDVMAISAMTILNKFQNNIKVQENKMILLIHSKSGYTGGCDFGNRPGLLVGQNYSHLKAGETLEISAGLGMYSRYAAPKISISGKNIEMKDAIVNYKLKVSNKIGKYSLPVTMEVIDQNGQKLVMTKQVEYIVEE